MSAWRSTGIIGAAVLLSGVAVTTPGQAETAKRPRGVGVNCVSPGLGGVASGAFTSSRNLVVGPIAMMGAGARPAPYSPAFGGQKFPTYLKAGHNVTVAVSRRTSGAKLVYGQRRPSRVITFVGCRRDEFERNPYEPHAECCFWFSAGGIVSPSPRCVHLQFWVDDQPSPRRAVVYLGVSRCS